MNTFFLQNAAGIEQYLLPAIATILGGALVAVLTRFMYRRKYEIDIHRTESETRKAEIEMAVSILDRLPDFLQRLEASHRKSLADETTIEDARRKTAADEVTIERLRVALKKCVDGRASCEELKDNLFVFLTEAEPVIAKEGPPFDLLLQLKRLRKRLE